MATSNLAEYEQWIRQLLSVLKEMTAIYTGCQLGDDEREALRENIRIGQVTTGGIGSVYNKLREGSADEGDLYIAGFLITAAENYISTARRFLSDLATADPV